MIDTKAKNEFIKFIVWKKFKYILTPGQANLVRKLVFMEDEKGNHCRRFSISAYTQYGKSFCVTIAIAILIDKGKTKVAFIGPLQEQSGILRDYMSDLILRDPSLLEKAMITAKGDIRITKESSKKRMTFTNGSEYRIFSAEGEAKRLMGFGVGITDGIGIIVKDESCLIPKSANAKIGRMMGNNPESCIFIELYNPWNSDNIAYEHTLDPVFDKTHINWQQGVREGRTTKAFVMNEKKDLSPLEFTVLYKSNFPEESEDSLFSLKKINLAEEKKWDFDTGLNKILEKLENPHLLDHQELKELKLELEKYVRIVSCDPADKGLDETVIYWGVRYENKYQLVGWYSEPKSDSMNLTGKVVKKAVDYIGRKVNGLVNIDNIGLGTGPFSRLKEVLHQEKNYKNIKIIGAHYGEAAIKKDHYVNKKAENYFVLQAIFNEELISIPVIPKLRTHLVAMKWDWSSGNKKMIVDPDSYSPDHSDCLCYFTWRDRDAFSFGFV